ncbi:lipopolysaccharide biosynthesis protein [Salidesulfovibrio brasiliensis]|uniref:lipopolysaccharide biosynthesis protein n=1 Tax=Salidesulfovibrio brasiliensis TaxID=221711 RepID=UPI0006CFF3E4|nr:oligosaccharide flippase family protein [Salidesulfovibrio brasiliensis]
MAGIKYLLGNSVMRNIAYAQTILIGLMVTPIIVRTLGSEGYGQWVLINTLLAYFVIFDFGFSTGVSRYVSREHGSELRDALQRYISTSFAVLSAALLLSLLIVAAGFLLFHDTVYEMIPPPLVKASTILVISYSVMIPLRVFHGVLRSQLRWNVISGIEIIKALVMNTCIVVLLLRGWGVYALIYCNAAFLILEYGAYYVFSKRALEYTLSPRYCDFATFKELWGYSLSFFANQMSVVFGRRIQNYFIAIFISVPAVTVYSIGVQLLGYFESCMLSIFDIFTPYFSRMEKDMDQVLEDYLQVSAYCFALSAFAGFMIFMYAKPFIYHWLGGEFLGSYEVVVLLCIPYVLYLSHIPGRNLLFGTSRHQFLVWLSVAECAVTFLLLVALIRDFGMDGVLWSMAGTMLVFRGVLFPMLLFRKVALSPLRYFREVYLRQSVIYLLPQVAVYFLIFRNMDVFSYEIGFVLLLQLLIFAGTLALFVRRDIRQPVAARS